MSETLKRLEETSHLLNELIKSNYNRSKFRTKLNSFISSARTITLVMQKEYKHISGFKEWYESKQIEMKGNELFKFFKKQRNIIQKEGSIRINVKASTKAVTDDKGKVIIPIGREKNGRIATLHKKWKVTNSFKDRPKEDAIDLCKKYFKELNELVSECNNKFSLTH